MIDVDALIKQILSKAVPIAGAGIIFSGCGPLVLCRSADGGAAENPFECLLPDGGVRFEVPGGGPGGGVGGGAGGGVGGGFGGGAGGGGGGGGYYPCPPTIYSQDVLRHGDGGWERVDGGAYPVMADGGLDLQFYGFGGCSQSELDAGFILVTCTSYCMGGRMTEGAELCGDDYFSLMASGEALSVGAFRRLERELRVHGGSPELIKRARKAAKDEIRHARIADRFRARRGAHVDRSSPKFLRLPVRGLREMLIENAVEGCVREAFCALMAAHQAKTATDTEFRRAMIGIAYDEARHAQLAFDIHRELSERLSADERQELVERARAAATELARETRGEQPALGLPSAETAQQMARLFADGVVPALSR